MQVHARSIKDWPLRLSLATKSEVLYRIRRVLCESSPTLFLPIKAILGGGSIIPSKKEKGWQEDPEAIIRGEQNRWQLKSDDAGESDNAD